MGHAECREYLNRVKRYVKIGTVAKDLGISQPNLSYYLKSECNDIAISLEKINKLVEFIQNEIV